MKRLLPYLLSLLAATLLLAAIPTDAEADVYRDTVRLHVLANSDSEEDQSEKLNIRDRLLAAYGPRLSGFEKKEDAEVFVRALLPEIEAAVCDWLCEAGFPYGATVTLTEEQYETREYRDFALPAGTYTSLRVILGAGEGHNWWCVMYPPLCLDVAITEDPLAPYSPEERRLVTRDGYAVKFKLLELLSELESGHKERRAP